MNGKDAMLSAGVVCAVLALVLATTDEVVWSWYIPLLGIASFLGFLDTARFLRGKGDFLNPGVLLGFVFLPLFIVAPIKQLAWDYWPFVPSLSRSIQWIDLWALLNCLGLVTYRLCLQIRIKPQEGDSNRVKGLALRIPRSKSSLFAWVLIFLSIGVAAQIFIYARFGGLTGFVEAFTARQEMGASVYDPFEGLGVPMIIADSVKMVLAIAIIYHFRRSRRAKSQLFFLTLMVFLAVVSLIFGGLRGSRSATLFALFCAAGMYHLQIRRLQAATIALGFVAFALFVSGYYWYKIAGSQGLDAITDSSARDSMVESRQDVGKYVIARDLGRMDVQVLALREIGSDTGPDYAFGRTYISSIFAIIPRFVIPWKPDQITKEKTEMLYGRGSYIPDSPRQTTLVLGQVGESFVNFSYLGVFGFFALLGFFVRRINRAIETVHREDLRLYLIPSISLLPVLMVITDFNVIFQQAARYLLIPALLIYITTSPRKRYYSATIPSHAEIV